MSYPSVTSIVENTGDRMTAIRAFTPNEYRNGRCTLHVKRECNGCGNLIGDVTRQEIEDAVYGRPLADVRDECPWCAGQFTLNELLAEQAEFEADLGYLHGLADALFEFGPPRRAGKYAFGLTVEDETLLAAPHDVFMTVAGSVMA